MDTAIILAGGFGTRLQSVVKDVPKPMADINGLPFLSYVLNYLKKFNFRNIVLCVGYKKESIQEYFGESYEGLNIYYSFEDEPLGTGGAIQKAILDYQNLSSYQNYLILNGDTFLEVNYPQFLEFHEISNSRFTLCLRKMHNFDRFGTVTLNENKEVIGFEEKKFQTTGFINGGVYLVNKEILSDKNLSNKFSMEKDFLEIYYKTEKFYGFEIEGYFIDIGIPEEYLRCKKDFQNLNFF